MHKTNSHGQTLCQPGTEMHFYSFSLQQRQQEGYIFAKHVKTILPSIEMAAIPLPESKFHFSVMKLCFDTLFGYSAK